MGMGRLYETAKKQINAGGGQFVEDLGLAKKHYGVVTSPGMMLLVLQSASFDCLWYAQTTRTVLSHASAQTFCAEARTPALRERFRHLVLLSSRA